MPQPDTASTKRWPFKLLILPVLLNFVDATLPATEGGVKCPVLTPSVTVDWNKIEGMRWFEALTYPWKVEDCFVRQYFPHLKTMIWKAEPGPYGTPTKTIKLMFEVRGDQQFLLPKGERFQQILDTDHSTWALIHHCWENGSGSHFALTLRKPVKKVPASILARAARAIAKSGRREKVVWTQSGCMISSTDMDHRKVLSPWAVLLKTALPVGIAAQGTTSSPTKCPVYKPLVNVDWKKIEGIRWYELYTSPKGSDRCYVRQYFPTNKTMVWQDKPGPRAKPDVVKKKLFEIHGAKQFLLPKGEKFQQILDTDHKTWALVHHCWEGGSGPRFLLTLKNPVQKVPASLLARTAMSIVKSGHVAKLTLHKSGCLLKGRNATNPVSVAVVVKEKDRLHSGKLGRFNYTVGPVRLHKPNE
ncbi:uncharacterized protein LOC144146485 [Haemaphysalis longicornis]